MTTCPSSPYSSFPGALSDFATALDFEASKAFGRKEEIEPTSFLIGAAVGWGGLPQSAAMYVIDSVAANDDDTPHKVTAKDVPVDGFWSITVYNADGYLEANDLGVNNYNNVTAEPNDDGSITIHFGGCGDDRANCPRHKGLELRHQDVPAARRDHRPKLDVP